MLQHFGMGPTMVAFGPHARGGVIDLLSVYASNRLSEFLVQGAFYAHFLVEDFSPNGDRLIVLGDFSDTTGAEGDGLSHRFVHTAPYQEMKLVNQVR